MSDRIRVVNTADASLRLSPTTGAPIELRSEWPPDLRPALAEAAGNAQLLAERNPLQYLGFAASDG